MFCLREMNNGILSATKAMPLKDLTSENGSNFAMDRKRYIRTLDDTVTVQQQVQKKWYGNSSVRDSTKVMEMRVRNHVGNGTLNYSKTDIAFVQTNSFHYTNQARRKVRNLGYGAPPKKTHYYTNTHIF